MAAQTRRMIRSIVVGVIGLLMAVYGTIVALSGVGLIARAEPGTWWILGIAIGIVLLALGGLVVFGGLGFLWLARLLWLGGDKRSARQSPPRAPRRSWPLSPQRRDHRIGMPDLVVAACAGAVSRRGRPRPTSRS